MKIFCLHPERFTNFSLCYAEKKIFLSKMPTLRIEKKVIIPTDQLYFYCCLAHKPAN